MISSFRSFDKRFILPKKKGAFFIVFEGLDGSGKGTQITLLADFLKEKKRNVVLTKEPTQSSPQGSVIRKVLANQTKIIPEKLQDLFCQDREWHLKNIIIPALKRGDIVISDRYFFSTIAYGIADGLNQEVLLQKNKSFLLPDIVFYLDVKPAVCFERIKKRGNKEEIFEKEGVLKKVRENYELIFNDVFKDILEIHFINGEQEIQKIFKDIKNLIKGTLF